MNKTSVNLSDKEKQALQYILGESLDENNDNLTFAQKVKNVAKKGLLTVGLLLALLPNLNAQQQAEVTKQYTQYTLSMNSQAHIETQQKAFQDMLKCGIIKKNDDGTITVCGGKSTSMSDSLNRTQRWVNICMQLGCVALQEDTSHTYYNEQTNTYRSVETLKLPSNLNITSIFENKQYNKMNKEELTEKIMRGLRESLNESKALDLKTNKDHKAAYNSFVKWYNRWKEKLGREEIRALVKKVSNDALGDNLDMINEAKQLYEWGKPGAADESLAEDIALTFRNTYELWERNAMWMVNALLKRLRKGQPVLEDHLANCGTMNTYARAAIDEYREDYPQTYVSTATRKLLKQKIAHDIFQYAMDEWEYEQDNE